MTTKRNGHIYTAARRREAADYAWAVAQPPPGGAKKDASAAADGAAAEEAPEKAEEEAELELGMRMRIVDGDEVLADSEAAGGFLAACRQFSLSPSLSLSLSLSISYSRQH